MRKVHFAVLLLLVVMSSFSMSASTLGFLKGDLNENGRVDVADVVTLIHFLLNDEWPSAGSSDARVKTIDVNGVPFNMVWVDAGTFVMGVNTNDDEAFDRELPAHEVTLSGYYIGQTEVTRELWKAVMGEGSELSAGDDRYPVSQAAWLDCQNFIAKLNELTGMNFRLPTEAEWEFAARGGIHSLGYKYAGSDDINEVAWHSGNASDVGEDHPDFGLHAVAGKRANELGLFDMSGNVYEWCHDWDGAYGAEAQTNPTGPANGSKRVYRGGGWGYDARHSRVSYRNSCPPAFSIFCLGFRLAM